MKPARVTRRPIDPARVLASVADREAGGADLFVGTVRRISGGKVVEGLTYEVYRKMAERKMAEIVERVRRKWPVVKLALVHRYGPLMVGEVSVAVAISCHHRAEAFEACRYAIDTIKGTLPMWKRERFRGGSEAWVKGTPMET